MKACRRALAVSEEEMPDGKELFKRMESDVHLRKLLKHGRIFSRAAFIA